MQNQIKNRLIIFANYIINLLSMSALAVSQIQKHFITNEIYKRGKRYFDVIKLKSIENQDSKQRRAPSTVQREQLQKKIENSFQSSEHHYNKKRLEEIDKCKKKHPSLTYVDDTDQIQTNYSVVTKSHSPAGKKSFDMSKGLSREFYQNLQTQTFTAIQDPFDNFVSSDFSKGYKGKSIDFNKILGRKDIISIQMLQKNQKFPKNQLNPEQTKSVNLKQSKEQRPSDLTKAYEKFYYDQSNFKCLIDVQKEKKAQHRKSLRASLKSHQMKEIPLQKIEKGRHFSQKQPTTSSLMFYHGKGKQEMSPMHYKGLKKNQNYLIEQLKVIKKEDFETMKRREEMIEKRIKQIKSKKEVIDERGQICDTKFFLRNRH